MAEVILALDLPDADEALRLLDRLPDVPVGQGGPGPAHGCGGPIRADVTPPPPAGLPGSQVARHPEHGRRGSGGGARDGGRDGDSAHLGGTGMLERAARAAGDELALLGVTVLTAHDADSYGRAVGRDGIDLATEVERLAGEARRAGLAGVVCSAREIALVREALGPAALVVVPGMRGRHDASGDQVRVSTAGDAAAQGATHLVVGRPVLRSADPAAAFRMLAAEAAWTGA